MSWRSRARVRRGIHGLPEALEAVGELVSGIASTVGDVLADLVGAAGAWRLGSVRVDVEERVGEPVVLLVEADASSVRVEEGPPGRVRVQGYRSRHGRVRVSLGKLEGKTVVRVESEAANVRVEAPLRALGVISDSSRVRVEARSAPLEYISVRADSSGVSARAALAEGGGVYSRLDSSAARIRVSPVGAGEYWVEVDADSSAFTVEFAGDKTYEVEEERLHASRLSVGGAGGAGPRVRVKVRVRADASLVRLT